MKLAILPAALAYSPIHRGYGLADLANRAMLWPHGRRSPGRQRLARRSSLAKGSLTSRRRCSHCPARPLPLAAIKPRSRRPLAKRSRRSSRRVLWAAGR